MGKVLNFNTVKKSYLTVTLSDENNTTVLLTSPTKAITDELNALDKAFKDAKADDTEALDDLYTLLCIIFNRNKGCVKISKKLLEETMDFEDIEIFFTAYVDFVTSITDQKN